MSILRSHQETAEKLPPIGAGIARSLALGLSLEDISIQYDTPLEIVTKIARGNLVKKRVREISSEIDNQFIKDAGESPVLLYAKQRGLAAIKRVDSEMDNWDKEDGGATASTRLAASKLMLEVGGNLTKRDDKGVSAVIMISADKVNLGKTIINQHVEAMPDYVDG